MWWFCGVWGCLCGVCWWLGVEVVWWVVFGGLRVVGFVWLWVGVGFLVVVVGVVCGCLGGCGGVCLGLLVVLGVFGVGFYWGFFVADQVEV
ncbi:hypothetical protein RA264_27760, partial [Pseudomonas syringae pv. tagetis]|uniref:hypothetical protein n=1 Tax=Pseudomonas syringae group genomosp. 7 TaxID=251699 RepID=UPI00376FFA3E